MAKGNIIEMTRGDSRPIGIRQKRPDGEYVPFVAGDTIYFTVKESTDTEAILIQKIITEFEDGVAKFVIKPSDTNALAPSSGYRYDVQLNTADGTVSTIIKPTTFSLLPEVTYD